jgi:hypothetical protein
MKTFIDDDGILTHDVRSDTAPSDYGEIDFDLEKLSILRDRLKESFSSEYDTWSAIACFFAVMRTLPFENAKEFALMAGSLTRHLLEYRKGKTLAQDIQDAIQDESADD